MAVDHTTYQSQVQFAPGDVVSVQADGCVQTGGHGNTWKRYVNPSGDETDTKYHGLMQIPTAFPAGSGLIRISNFIGKLQLVRGDPNVPASQLFLTLGYEDSDYGDNGYDNHDDGTDDQCKTSISNNGEAAYVSITIFRKVTPVAPASRYDFDVVPTLVTGADPKNTDLDHIGMDHNGLLLNPEWSWQQNQRTLNPKNPPTDPMPSTSQCHELSARPSVVDIPEPYLVPYVTNCTDQMDVYNTDSDMEGAYQWGLCSIRKGGPFAGGSWAGHFNWFPVTLEGRSNWGDHADWTQLGDDDYTFNFHSPSEDPLSVNGRHGLHVEFDSDETIDNFHIKEWQDLRGAVDAASSAKGQLANCDLRHNCTADQIAQINAAIKAPAKFFDGDTAVLTGMYGLDGEHDLKAELHPLFAFASQLNSHSDPLDEVWLMFARNRGDEGFCSSRLWDSGLEDYIVHLRWRAGATGVQVNQNKTHFEGPEGTSGPDFMIVPPGSPDEPGVYAIFHLGPAESKPVMDGTVHLIWTGASSILGQGNVVATTSGQIEITPAKPGPARPTTPTKSKTASSASSKLPTEAKTAPVKPSTPPSTGTAEVEDSGDVEVQLGSTASQLTDAQLKAIAAAHPPAAKLTMHELPLGKVQTVSAIPPSVRSASIKTYNAGPATEKVARDKANVKALCSATNNAPPGLSADVCKLPAYKP